MEIVTFVTGQPAREPVYIVVRERKHAMEYPVSIRNGKKDSHVVRPNYRGLGSVSWRDISADSIAELVRLCASNSAAVMFGATSDGGALSLCILMDRDKIKEYPRTQTEIDSFLLWLSTEYFSPPLSTKK